MEDIGVAGMVRTGDWCERTLGMEVLSCGRAALAKEDCVLELCGRALYYWIAIRATWIWVAACPLDEQTGIPDFLFNVGDGPQGWSDVRRFVQALERSGITSLKERPIRIGEGGPNSFIIG
jgi:GH24 family phage-related lysozyme (muramidase)